MAGGNRNNSSVHVSRRRFDSTDLPKHKASAGKVPADDADRHKKTGSVDRGIMEAEEDPAVPQRVRLPDGWTSMAISGPSLTETVKRIGGRGLRVDQWYNVDVPEDTSGKVRSLVLFYKWRPNRGDRFKWNASHAVQNSKSESSGGGPTDVFFVNQLINSASGTQAILAALLNVAHSGTECKSVDVGEEVRVLLNFAKPLPPIVRAAAITSAAAVWNAHEAASLKYGRRSLKSELSEEGAWLKSGQDFWLYSIYMPGKSGKWVYEMEGCAQEPNVLGSSSTEARAGRNDWVDVLTDPLETLIKELRAHHVPFELYALVDDTAQGDGADSEDTPRKGNSLRENGHRAGKSEDMSIDSESEENSDSRASRRTGRGNADGPGLGKRKRRADREREMERERKIATHNYDAFFVEMLKLMASKGQLTALIDNACREDDGNGEGEQVADGEDVEGSDMTPRAVRTGRNPSEDEEEGGNHVDRSRDGSSLSRWKSSGAPAGNSTEDEDGEVGDDIGDGGDDGEESEDV